MELAGSDVEIQEEIKLIEAVGGGWLPFCFVCFQTGLVSSPREPGTHYIAQNDSKPLVILLPPPLNFGCMYPYCSCYGMFVRVCVLGTESRDFVHAEGGSSYS